MQNWKGTLLLSVFLLFGDDRSVLAEVYLTKTEALEVVCGSGESLYDPKPVTPDLVQHMDDLNLSLRDERMVHFFTCPKTSIETTHALIDQELGKHLPMTYIVGFGPEGVITHVELMVFREKYGSGVKSKKFMKQFDGLNADSEYRVGRGIKHVTGATISSKGIAKGARKASILWNWYYKK